MRSRTKQRLGGVIVVLVAGVGAGSVHADTDDDGDGPEGKAILPTKIDDLIEVAVRLAPDLSRARIDRQVARDSAAATRRGQAWVLSSEARYSRDAFADHVDRPLFSVVGSETLLGSLAVGRALPTGGSISVGVDVQHQTQELNIPTGLQLQQQTAMGSGMGSGSQAPFEFVASAQTAARVTFKQPLSRGFGHTIALATERKADLAAAEATINSQLAAEKLVKEIITAYWELAYSAYEVEVRNQSLDLAKKQEVVTHEEVRGGLAPLSALNAVKYEIATRSEALLRSQLDWEAKSLDLRRKVGLEIGRREIVMQPGEPFEIGKDDDVNIDDVVARSRAANRQLAAIAVQKKAADIEVAAADDLTKPQLDFQLQGALMGQGEGVGDSVSTVGNSYQVSASLTFQWEISGAARRGRDAAHAKKRRLDIDRADAERSIDTAIVAAGHQVSAARMRVSLADQAIAIADENVRSERASFAANKSTNFQVMNRQSQLIDAKLRRGRAIADYHVAIAQLQFLGGMLLDQYRIDVHPRAERR
jgi:outer membrane protein TolC